MAIFVKKLGIACLILLTSITSAQAAKPLRIATTQLFYPFVIKAANQLYGFDIAMMTYICEQVQRECKYEIMPFSQLLPSIADKKADLAVSAITITADRAQIVNFSTPYLVSEISFLAQSTIGKRQIDVTFLSSAKIATLAGTIMDDAVKSLGVVNPNITHFNSEPDMIEALIDGIVDLALLDAPTATYWQGHSAGALVAIGKPFPYGFGLGIAVNKEEIDLLNQINAAVLKYQNSNNFKIDYGMYLEY